MKASVPIQVRVPTKQYRIVRRAAKLAGKTLAGYLRDAAVGRACDELIACNDPMLRPK